MNIISRDLSTNDVVLGLDVRDKKQALEEAALLVERRHQVDHASVFRALWRREQSGSTGLGYGVAIPHARVTGISEPIILFVRTRVPINFDAPDHQAVSILFVILVPEHANEEHLQILATVSAMFSDKAVRERLAAAPSAAAIQRLFGEYVEDNRSSP